MHCKPDVTSEPDTPKKTDDFTINIASSTSKGSKISSKSATHTGMKGSEPDMPQKTDDSASNISASSTS